MAKTTDKSSVSAQEAQDKPSKLESLIASAPEPTIGKPDAGATDSVYTMLKWLQRQEDRGNVPRSRAKAWKLGVTTLLQYLDDDEDHTVLAIRQRVRLLSDRYLNKGGAKPASARTYVSHVQSCTQQYLAWCPAPTSHRFPQTKPRPSTRKSARVEQVATSDPVPPAAAAEPAQPATASPVDLLDLPQGLSTPKTVLAVLLRGKLSEILRGEDFMVEDWAAFTQSLLHFCDDFDPETQRLIVEENRLYVLRREEPAFVDPETEGKGQEGTPPPN